MPYNLKTNIKIFGGTDTTPGSRVYLEIKKDSFKMLWLHNPAIAAN